MKKRLSEKHCEIIKDMEGDFAIRKFPWIEKSAKEFETPFGDITELYDFIH
jgi:hypothetical protein